MHAAGWVGLSWPKEYGGRGANFMQQVIFDEEFTRARAPVLPGASGLNLLGPYAMVDAPTEAVPDASRWFHRVLGARQYTIAGGTSEIQRNIIGERVLGLPKG